MTGVCGMKKERLARVGHTQVQICSVCIHSTIICGWGAEACSVRQEVGPRGHSTLKRILGDVQIC